FKKLTSARMLHLSFTPNADEIKWASERTNTPEALFAVVLALKCHQKMARLPSAAEVPDEVVDHVRRHLDLGEDVEPDHGSGRTAKWHRKQIRTRLGVTYDPSRARKIAAEAIREAARSRHYPPDLINAALDRLVEASVELPGFSTLDEMATRIRGEANAEIFAQVNDRMGEEGRARLKALVAVAEDGYSMFNRLKKPAKRATWSRFKAQ
ncbi:transposase, partial [Streptomonospora alba]